jgi:ankyrin repeat protein
MLAAEKGYIDVVKKLLLAPKIDLNAQNGRGDTAIHVVAINAHLSEKDRVNMINLLASHGAKVDIRNKARRTAWLDASKSGYLKVVQELKKHGADINQVTGANGWSGLHEAAGQAHVEVAKWLLSKKIDTTVKTKG